MNNLLINNATSALRAFNAQDYANLDVYGTGVYNYFVHNPVDILNLNDPLLIGKVFQACLGFQEPDESIQEVRAENAFLCFSQALISSERNVQDEAAARLAMLLIHDRTHLTGKVTEACLGENRYHALYAYWLDDMPMDMPEATSTKMLFTAYYLYNKIFDKVHIADKFTNTIENRICVDVVNHVLAYCHQLQRHSDERKIALGNIVYNKICEQLRNDIQSYASTL